MDQRLELERAQQVDVKTSVIELVRELQETCDNCKPISAVICLTSCNVWELKNQLRKAHDILKDSDYTRRLWNVLKNGRRLQILKIAAEEKVGITRLQDRLREEGYNHSRETVTKEYMIPMMDAGLVEEKHEHYSATILGRKINELTKSIGDFEKLFPPHSECYEETSIDALLENSRTFKDFGAIIPPKTVARVLKRLEEVSLVETKEENDYIFYFKTKRDRRKSELSSTEEKVYENIASEGVPVKRIAAAVGISLRRTYKYLRRLRGKKLVFTRRIPKIYRLTEKGIDVAVALKRMRHLSLETLEAATRLLEDEKIRLSENSEKRERIPLTPIRIGEPD